jgi:hypothetical protein
MPIGGARCGTIRATNTPDESGSQLQIPPVPPSSRTRVPSIVKSCSGDSSSRPRGDTIHRPSGDATACPGTAESTLYRFGTEGAGAEVVVGAAVVGAVVAEAGTLAAGDGATALGPPHAAVLTQSASAATSDLISVRLGERCFSVVRLLICELVRDA